MLVANTQRSNQKADSCQFRKRSLVPVGCPVGFPPGGFRFVTLSWIVPPLLLALWYPCTPLYPSYTQYPWCSNQPSRPSFSWSVQYLNPSLFLRARPSSPSCEWDPRGPSGGLRSEQRAPHISIQPPLAQWRAVAVHQPLPTLRPLRVQEPTSRGACIAQPREARALPAQAVVPG